MKPTVKMILLTLLGLFLPFGAIWGPFLVKTKSEEERRFRSRLLIAEVVVWVSASSSVFLVLFYATTLFIPT